MSACLALRVTALQKRNRNIILGHRQIYFIARQGTEYGVHSLSEFRSWLVGLQQTGALVAYEDMRNSVCWRTGSADRTTVWQALAPVFGSV